MAMQPVISTTPSLEADSFEAVARAAVPRLLTTAYAILRDAAEAEDAVQDALLLAWRSWERLRDPARREAWLLRICVRRCLRLRTTLLARWRHEAVAAEAEPAVRSVTPVADTVTDLRGPWRSLSPSQRAVIVLHYRYGHTLDECARLMGCRPGTARQHLSRGLAKLRRHM